MDLKRICGCWHTVENTSNPQPGLVKWLNQRSVPRRIACRINLLATPLAVLGVSLTTQQQGEDGENLKLLQQLFENACLLRIFPTESRVVGRTHRC